LFWFSSEGSEQKAVLCVGFCLGGSEQKVFFCVGSGSVQGILAVKSEVCQSPEILAALFHNECSRVISDRFIDAKDTEVFEAIMEKVSGSVYL
jgi:hypothetical protein